MLIDTHAHVNFKAFENDAKEVLQRALDAGVWVVNVGTQLDTSKQCVELANQFTEGVYAVVGLHPVHTYSQHLDEEETHFLTREEKFHSPDYRTICQNSKVVGIGECGLDYFRLPLDELGTSADGLSLHQQIKEKQKAAFRAQIQLAKELNKALVIHSRPAKDNEELFDDLIKILDEEGVSGSNVNGQKSNVRFEVHSFTGSPAALQKFLDRGAYVSFNGIITFDKTGNMASLVKLAPLDRIILETDCPYLTPVPNRGKRNEPSFVKFVAEKVALIKNLSVDEIAEATTKNAKNLFKL